MTPVRVPFLDVGATYRELRTEIDAAVQRVLNSGRFVLGPEVENFESQWADYCEVSHCVGVGSGLDALVLALRALDVGPGDEVIVPSHTFIATWLAVTAVGATIVPVEPDESTYNITATAIDAAVTSKTAAIMPVHLYGLPVDVVGIDAVAERYGIPVVYDAAQAHGARVVGKSVGAFGTLSAWSFYPGKNLGAFGDGGAVTSNDTSLLNRIRKLRNYGSKFKYQHEEVGANSRLDEIQAATLSVKLKKLNQWNKQRAAIADLYMRALTNSGLVLPVVPERYEPSWHLFVVRSDNRNELQEQFNSLGLQTGIHYPIPIHLQQAYRDETFTKMPCAEALAKQVLSLSIGPHCNPQNVSAILSSFVP